MSPEDEQDWIGFERAVATFVGALDSGATVRHDVRLPDRHTGHPRQRDVWVEAKVCGFFPVTILISCKRLMRKLHEGDIDAFWGELQSSGAPIGVLFAETGFGDRALQKAAHLGIHCCRLYRDQPADLPQALLFRSYCCRSQVALAAIDVKLEFKEATWGDVLSLRLGRIDGAETVLDRVCSVYRDSEAEAVSRIGRDSWLPQPWAVDIGFEAEDGKAPFRLRLSGRWQLYSGKLEGHLLNGAYLFSTGEFRGTQATPSVDRLGPHPGPGWVLIEDSTEIPERPLVAIVLYNADLREALRTSWSTKPLLQRDDV